MTNKDFFIETMKAEAPVFVKVIQALPKEQADFKPHEKGRTARSLAAQLATQPTAILEIATTGVIDGSGSRFTPDMDFDSIAKEAEKNYAKLINDLALLADEDWDEGSAKLVYPGGQWETTRYEMAWGFLLDAIHHRGQLTAYLRMMGAKVPSVYGGSADERPTA